MLRKHVRRPDPMPRGQFHHFGCDCGFEGKVPIHSGGRLLQGDNLTERAEAAWVAHVPPRERRVYLLLDTRPPEHFQPLDEIKDHLRALAAVEGAALDDQLLAVKAQVEFQAQRPIRGNYVMPEGLLIDTMLAIEERGGKDWGRFQVKENGPVEELPVGEIRLPDGRVFCAE